MKSLKEFITENLENPTVLSVQESNEKQVDENNNQEPTAQKNETANIQTEE